MILYGVKNKSGPLHLEIYLSRKWDEENNEIPGKLVYRLIPKSLGSVWLTADKDLAEQIAHQEPPESFDMYTGYYHDPLEVFQMETNNGQSW